MRWEGNSPASPLLQPGVAGLRQQQAHAVRPRGECCGQRRDEFLDHVTEMDVEGRWNGTRTETRCTWSCYTFDGQNTGWEREWERPELKRVLAHATCHQGREPPSHGTPELYPGAGFHSHPLGLISLLPPAAAAGMSPQQEAPAKVACTSDGHKWRDRATEGKSSS